jgi:hypothetical protein
VRDAAKRSATGSSTRQGSRAGAVIAGAPATRCASRGREGTRAPAGRLALILAGAAAILALALPAVASAAPVLTIDPVGGPSITAAHVSGTTDSGSINGVVWVFQTSTDGSTWTDSSVLGQTGGGFAPVEGTLGGLTAGTAYQVRLFATVIGGSEAVTSPVSFETDPAPNTPSLELDVPSGVSYTSAHLSGSFDPEGGNEDALTGPIPITARLELNREGHGWNPVGSAVTLQGSDALSSADFPIEADPTNLLAGAHYEFSLNVRYAGLSKVTPPGEFDTTFLAKPVVTELAVTDVTTTSAHFSAEIDPGGSNPLSATSWHFECTPSCGGLSGGTVPAGASGEELQVENDAVNLQPNAVYVIRLVASNAAGEVKQTESFQTPPLGPLIKAWAAGPIAATSADINAQVDPRGSATVYWFEWGTADCSANPCAALPPEHDASAGAGQTYAYVIRHLSGLSPNTTYHFRVVARSASGTTTGDDQTFTTAAPEPPCSNPGLPGTNFLPDCRAYELVSPPDKNGGNAGSVSNRTQAADDGNATTFLSTVAFGEVPGTSLWLEYMARRDAKPGTNGWSSHAITPPQKPMNAIETALGGTLPQYQGDFSADLSKGVFLSRRPLTTAPNADAAANLYLRSDLQSAGAGSYRLLTDSKAPTASLPVFSLLGAAPDSVGASSDFSHVIFETKLGLTEEGPSAPQVGETKLYENAEGTVRVVGRVPVEPATSCDDAGPSAVQCVEAESSAAGIPAAGYSARMISADGSRIFFQTPSQGEGNIYLREDGTKTFQINASETEPPAPPSPSGHAKLWDASRDGSRAFFTTNESLVEEDEDGGNFSLYMYEADKPEGKRLTLMSVDHEPADGASFIRSVVGASDDGRYVYFVAGGQLVADEPLEASAGLYLWHDGRISYLGEFADANIANANSADAGWSFGSKVSRVTPDGRHLLFSTSLHGGFKGVGGFGGYERGGGQAFIYDADSGRLRCVSCNSTGAGGASGAFLDVLADTGPISWAPHLSQAVSDDGRYVFFSTPDPLVPEDTNGTWDAYEYDTITGEQHLLSSGVDSKPSYFMDASANGQDAFFTTSERLSGWDTDTSVDLYDARVGGGLPEPAPVPAACAGESCLPSTAPSPATPPTASESTGAGNAKAGRCPKGKVRKHGKCVKKHHPGKHHGRRHKRAGSTSGGGK